MKYGLASFNFQTNVYMRSLLHNQSTNQARGSLCQMPFPNITLSLSCCVGNFPLETHCIENVHAPFRYLGHGHQKTCFVICNQFISYSSITSDFRHVFSCPSHSDNITGLFIHDLLWQAHCEASAFYVTRGHMALLSLNDPSYWASLNKASRPCGSNLVRIIKTFNRF